MAAIATEVGLDVMRGRLKANGWIKAFLRDLDVFECGAEVGSVLRVEDLAF